MFNKLSERVPKTYRRLLVESLRGRDDLNFMQIAYATQLALAKDNPLKAAQYQSTADEIALSTAEKSAMDSLIAGLGEA